MPSSSSTNRSTWVNIYSCVVMSILCHNPWDKRNLLQIKDVCQTIHINCQKSRIGENNLLFTLRSRVTIKASLHIFQQHLLHFRKLLKKSVVASLFAVSGLICWCGISQVISNSVSEAFSNAFSIPPLVTTLALTALAAVIVLRKDATVKSLDVIVPIMAGCYFLMTLYVVFTNLPQLPGVTDALLASLDVLVDGPFIEEQKNLRLRFRGSENQRLIDMPQTLKAGAVVLCAEEQ